MKVELSRIPLDKFPPNARRFVEPSSPKQMKRMVADALVPMKPVIQVCTLYQFALDDDEDLSRRASASLARLPVPTLIEVVKKPLLPMVLHWICMSLSSSREIVRTILTNSKTQIDTLIAMAQKADEDICELLARNQIRLVESGALVEALFFNPNMRSSSVDRMLDFAARNNMDLPNIPSYQEIVADIQGQTAKSAAEEAAADAQFRQLMDQAKTEAEEETSTDESQTEVARPVSAQVFDDEDSEDEERMSRSAAGRIRDLNVAQKVRLAMMGSSTERGILIKDTNKLVARSVIRSPAISDSEVMTYAKNKSLLDEVIAYIASNKKWIRHYQVKKNLVNNPKTPLSQTMKFLTHLRTPDLRLVAKSRDVPGPVAKAAKQLIKSRLEK